ncbi:MAG: cobyrinate a,c-diamide synthase [Pseudomonadota bacterium]
MSILQPRIIIAALKGGSGKTILSLGMASHWRQKGYKVATFKKGPDFIDAGWLAFASGRPCHNLDPFLMSELQIIQSFYIHSSDADISLIEGNRGLFDGMDLNGCCSTAELGKIIKTPVLIIADVTMATRTVAAIVMGCQKFDPELRIEGVILNRVAGSRQESLVRNAIEKYCGIPVVGSVPKLRGDIFPERHMGLVPYQEREHAEKAIAWSRAVVEQGIDLETVWKMAHTVGPIPIREQHVDKVPLIVKDTDSLRIGFLRDRAFWFYYPENLDQLRNLGATLVEVDSIVDRELPALDALYIGGGFPETQAEELANNKSFRNSLRHEIEKGLPVYAECGGLMYLGESLILNGISYPMVGALSLSFVLEKKPQGHGYTILEVIRENPFYPVGTVLKGHEFHYSRPISNESEEVQSVFKIQRGQGLDGQRDGLVKKNLLATYTHIHATGNPSWGENFFKVASITKKLRKKKF